MCEYVRLFLELTADERNRVVARWINDGVPPFYAELTRKLAVDVPQGESPEEWAAHASVMAERFREKTRAEW